jgi:hypothetical protein
MCERIQAGQDLMLLRWGFLRNNLKSVPAKKNNLGASALLA